MNFIFDVENKAHILSITSCGVFAFSFFLRLLGDKTEGRQCVCQPESESNEPFWLGPLLMILGLAPVTYILFPFLQHEAREIRKKDNLQRQLSRYEGKKNVFDSVCKICAKPNPESHKYINCIWELVMYRLDFHFSSDTATKPAALLCATLLIIFFGAVVMSILTEKGFLSSLWIVWTWVSDPGTHADTESSIERTLAFLLTILGMLIFGLMIGIVAEVVSEKVDNLKKGSSRVVEVNHTLILGWSDKIIPTIHEICLANESEGGGTIVVMAERDKQEMEEQINERAHFDFLGTCVICRSGSPIIANDLEKVAAQSARSIIALTEDDVDPDVADTMAVRIVLSLKSLGEIAGHAVIEMSDIDNRELVHLVGGKKVETVVAHDLIGRLMIQCARQPGLALVLNDLLGFQGSEFYIKAWPELTGMTFGEICYAFEDAIVVGIIRKGAPEDDDEEESIDLATSIINPSDDLVLLPTDEILVIAEDDDTYQPLAKKRIRRLKKNAELNSFLPNWKEAPAIAENLLFVGWRRDIEDMICELDENVGENSTLTLFSSVPIDKRKEMMRENGLEEDMLKNLTLVHVQGNPVLRRDLERLCEYSPMFDSALILSDASGEPNMTTSDSQSLATILLLRDIQDTMWAQRMLRSSRGMSKQNSSEELSKPKKRVLNQGGLSEPSNLRNIVATRREALALAMIASDNSIDSLDGNSNVSQCPDFELNTITCSEGKKQFTMEAALVRKLLREKLASMKKAKSANDLINQSSLQKNCTMIAEILDSRTKALVMSAKISDYVLSNELVAKVIATVSECRIMNDVLSETLSAAGNETYIRESRLYADIGEVLTFWDIIARGRLRKEIVFGYRLNGKNWVINPSDKSEKRKWSQGDLIVVLAE